MTAVSADAVYVLPLEGAVVVGNAQELPVKVVDLTGRTVASVTPASDLEQIPVGKGLYIVVVNNKAYKVLVQ